MRSFALTCVALAVALCACGTASAAPSLGGCQVFPSADSSNRGTLADFNRDISSAPVHRNSDAYVASIGTGSNLHPDFGSNPDYGIPYIVVPSDSNPVKVRFTDYADESDPGPYPIPRNAPVEAGSDHHVLALQKGACKLYELFNASYSKKKKRWNAAGGAVFDLGGGGLRHEGWTSADAAGLPILPGLVRRDEVQAGEIDHAIRVTVQHTQRAYLHPATHFASSNSDSNLPPMGLRLRLKAGYDISSFPHDAKVILTALKRYGMIVADNGGNWFITGETNPDWDDDDLDSLKSVPGSAFEAVDTGESLHTG